MFNPFWWSFSRHHRSCCKKCVVGCGSSKSRRLCYLMLNPVCRLSPGTGCWPSTTTCWASPTWGLSSGPPCSSPTPKTRSTCTLGWSRWVGYADRHTSGYSGSPLKGRISWFSAVIYMTMTVLIRDRVKDKDRLHRKSDRERGPEKIKVKKNNMWNLECRWARSSFSSCFGFSQDLGLLGGSHHSRACQRGRGAPGEGPLCWRPSVRSAVGSVSLPHRAAHHQS